MKRPAANDVGRPLKRVAANPPDPTDEVVKALQEAGHLPEGLVAMLCKSARMVLHSNERHPFEAKVVDMIQTVLEDAKSSMSNKMEEVRATIAKADEEKLELDATVSKTTNVLEQKTAVSAERKQALSEATAACNAANVALQEAVKAQQKGNASAADVTAKLEKLGKTLDEAYAPLKDGPKEGDKIGKREFSKLLKAVLTTFAASCDKSLMRSLETTLETTPADRDEFDKLVLSHFETQCAAYRAKLEEVLTASKQENADHAEREESARKAVALAEQDVATCKEAADVAEEEQATANKEAAAARHAVDDFFPEMERRKTLSSSLEERLKLFVDGPLKTFAVLKSPPPPEVAETKATDEAAMENPAPSNETIPQKESTEEAC